MQLQAVTLDANGATLTGRHIAWATSDVAIATVSSSGVVTGLAEGDATVTATSETKSGSAAVTVQAVPQPELGILRTGGNFLLRHPRRGWECLLLGWERVRPARRRHDHGPAHPHEDRRRSALQRPFARQPHLRTRPGRAPVLGAEPVGRGRRRQYRSGPHTGDRERRPRFLGCRRGRRLHLRYRQRGHVLLGRERLRSARHRRAR